MPKLDIDIRALFTYSWMVFKRYASFIIGVSFTYFALGLLPQVYIYFFSPENPTPQSTVVSIVALIVRLVLLLGFTKIMLYLIDDRTVSVADLVNNGKILLSYVLAWFLYSIAVGIGLFLFIIPGIYLAIRLQFYPFYIIENDETSLKALQKSWYATEDFTFELVIFGICFLVANFVGAFCLGIGMIFTYPITMMAEAAIFKSLEDDTSELPVPRYKP
jgi:uncharacterized membrane protein